jgi:hypothetical protein
MSWLNLILLLGLLSAGCSEHVLYQRFEKDMWSNYMRLNEVHVGMSKGEVVGIMGQPGTREDGDYRGGRYTIYFYLTHSMDFPDSNTVRGGYTPLVFKDNRLEGIGKLDYRRAVDRPDVGSLPNPSPGNR